MKNIKKIIITLIVLNFILLILQVLIYNKKSNIKESNVEQKSEATAIELEDKLYPAGSFKFTYLYDGSNNIEIFYKKIGKFVNYLEDLYKDTKQLTSEELNEYYRNNKEKIENITGIETIDKFKELVEQVNKCNIDEKYDKLEMINDTYQNNDTECSIQINISYKNGKMVKITAFFAKNDSEKNIAKFIPLETE